VSDPKLIEEKKKNVSSLLNKLICLLKAEGQTELGKAYLQGAALLSEEKWEASFDYFDKGPVSFLTWSHIYPEGDPYTKISEWQQYLLQHRDAVSQEVTNIRVYLRYGKNRPLVKHPKFPEDNNLERLYENLKKSLKDEGMESFRASMESDPVKLLPFGHSHLGRHIVVGAMVGVAFSLLFSDFIPSLTSLFSWTIIGAIVGFVFAVKVNPEK
jgi:hypothetical protein|tara:strand:- start:754 stop:1392 length:639 start_codon:yes stop_codon:yes gene_type:complete